MQPTDRKRFALCLMAAAELYGKTVSKALGELYWNALAMHDIDAVEHAFQAHIAQGDAGQFMPKPADIAKLIVGTTKDASMVAWSKVDKAVREVGPYASVTFDDAITMRVLQDMGGWTMLCSKDDEAWPFIANEFMSRYQGFRSRGELPDHPTTLIGISEAENTRKGFGYTQHVLIGNQTAAKRIIESGQSKPFIAFTKVADVLRIPNDVK